MNVGKITGMPVKVLCMHRICIPAEYLKHYALSVGMEISVEIGESWLMVLAHGDNQCTKITLQKNQLLRLPVNWVAKNRIQTGDILFLIGTSRGMLFYTKKRQGLSE